MSALRNAKHEQETAVHNLPHGRDVMAVFGQSMIFTVRISLFPLTRQELLSTRTSIVAMSLFKNIIDDQISEILSLNFTAMELPSDIRNKLSLFQEVS